MMPIDPSQFDKDGQIGKLPPTSSSDSSAQMTIAQRRNQKPFLRLHSRERLFAGLTAALLAPIILALVAFPNELQREALSLRWNHNIAASVLFRALSTIHPRMLPKSASIDIPAFYMFGPKFVPARSIVYSYGSLKQMDFLPDGRHLLISNEGDIDEWDVTIGRYIRTVVPRKQIGLEISHLKVSPDGEVLALATDDGHVRLFDINFGLEQKTFVPSAPPHQWGTGPYIFDLAFSPDSLRHLCKRAF